MVIFGREINFSVFFGFNGSQKFPLFRWLLIPTAFFLIVIPSRILLLAQNRNLNHTTVISLEDDDNSSKISQGLFLITNNLYLGGDIIYLICGCLITLFGIFGFLRRNNAVGQFISAFLIAFTVIHAISAAYTVLFSNRWIFRVLDDTWENSFIYDNELIHEIQNEFSCKGFSSMLDRSIESVITTTISSPSSSKTVESIISSSSSSKKFLSFEQSCAKILMQRYGPHLFHVAKIIFLARFIQLLAVLLHTFILHCVIINDIQQSIRQEECEEYNNSNSNINSNNGIRSNNSRNNNSRSSNNSSNSSSNSSNNNYNNNSNYDDDKNYNDWEFEDDDDDDDDESNGDVENFEDVEDNNDDTKLLLHHYRNRNHRKYLRYDEVDDVNDELIDELVEKNLDLIKFNNSILKSIYYNSRN